MHLNSKNQTRRNLKSMNPKNMKKSSIHKNRIANITCDFGDDRCRIAVARLENVISVRTYVCVQSSYSLSLSRSISSSGRRCPDVTAKLFPVLCHSACRCHRTERIRDVFLPSLSWLSSASFPGYHSLHYCLL